MKFSFNGTIANEEELFFGLTNSSFQKGDFLTEEIKISNGSIVLLEEHYFNLMASMRIFRMKIPLEFTQEFFEDQIQQVLVENSLVHARLSISVFRNFQVNTQLNQQSVSFLVYVNEVFTDFDYQFVLSESEIEVYKDFTVNDSFFTQINTHKPEEIIARAYMEENNFDDLILLNSEKRIARSVLGTPFLVNGNRVQTPKLSEGGIRSVTRNQFMKSIENSSEFQLEELEIYPFELQKCEELFILKESWGIVSICKNRKKIYVNRQTQDLFKLLILSAH